MPSIEPVIPEDLAAYAKDAIERYQVHLKFHGIVPSTEVILENGNYIYTLSSQDGFSRKQFKGIGACIYRDVAYMFALINFFDNLHT